MKKLSLLTLLTAAGIAAGSTALPVQAAGAVCFPYETQNVKAYVITGGRICSLEDLKEQLSGWCSSFPNIPEICRPENGTDQPEVNLPETDNDAPEVSLPETDNDGPEVNLPETDNDQPEVNLPETDNDAPEGNLPETGTDQPEINLPGTDTNAPGTNSPETDNDAPGVNPPAEDNTPETGELSFAEQVVALVNAERAKAGLNPLVLDEEIASAALVRARETEISFSHTRPDGRTFSTVLTDNGIKFRGAGENIAWGQRSPEEVMEGWMNSAGHRANILNPNFTKIGVGYYQNAAGRNFWTQLFTY